jgi:ubiquinone/menaquinone biosynthesis C-methylase UbiE
MNAVDPKVTNFYTQSSEETRLQLGLGPLEFERNKDIISRYLPKLKGVVADVGGGPGHYAEWLSAKGHEVILIDPVPKHIQQAEKRAKKSKHVFKAVLGEAGHLPFANGSVDVVILHGPLYHLQEQKARLAALHEAKRVLKKGGIVLGFAITYSATLVAALQSSMIHHKDIFAMCKEELLTGKHNAPASFPGILASAYFHRPSQLQEEFEISGLKKIALLAVEGMIWMDQKYFESWAIPEKKQQLLELLKITENHSELLCFSPHMVLIASPAD